MDVTTTLKPGDMGTKHLVREYGERLVCVRYRYDGDRHKRFKTVELIVDRPVKATAALRPDAEPVAVRLPYDDGATRELMKRHGGRWDPQTRLWWLGALTVRMLGFERYLTR